MASWQRHSKGKIEDGIRQRDATTGEVVDDPANGRFIFQGSRFHYIFMDETPTEQPQGPPTEGPTPPSTPPIRNPCSLHELFTDVHQAGAHQSAKDGPEIQCHGISSLTIICKMICQILSWPGWNSARRTMSR